ncbi:MAG TPA: MFS transporter [Streptosporangiaceae bacterium]
MSGAEADKRASAQDAALGEAAGVWVTFRQTPRVTKAILVGVFVNSLAGFIQIFLVLFLTNQGFSSGQASFALGLYGAGAVLGTFVGGALTDRMTVRMVTLISTLGSALLMIAILYFKSYPLVLLSVLLVSAVRQLYRPAAQAMIAEQTPPSQLVMVMAMYRLSLNLGTSAAPVIGVALISVSYSLLFWGQAVAAVVYGLIALLALPGKATLADLRPQAVQQTRSGYRLVLADLRFMAFVVAIFLRGSVYVQYTTALPLAIHRADVSLWWYSAVVSINALMVVTCEVFLTKFTQKWPLRITAVTAFGLLAVGYAVYAIQIAPAFLVIGTLIWTLSEIVGAPTAFAYPSMVAPPGMQGRYIGAMQSALGLGMTIGPIVGVWLLNSQGRWVWIWIGGVALLSTVAARAGMVGPAARPPPSREPAVDPPEPATKPAR